MKVQYSNIKNSAAFVAAFCIITSAWAQSAPVSAPQNEEPVVAVTGTYDSSVSASTLVAPKEIEVQSSVNEPASAENADGASAVGEGEVSVVENVERATSATEENVANEPDTAAATETAGSAPSTDAAVQGTSSGVDAKTEQVETENAESAAAATETADIAPSTDTVEQSSSAGVDAETAQNEAEGATTVAEETVASDEEIVQTEEPPAPSEPEPYYGWRVVTAATAMNPNTIEIATFAGRTASVTIVGGFIEDAQLQSIGRTLDAVWTIPGLQVRQASVYVEDSQKFRFVLFPSSFVYEGAELKEYFPSGVAFWYDEALFYDVVMKVRELKPRVAGTFASPADFAAILYRATIVPDLYMYDNNLVERVERLEKALLALSSKGFFARPYQINENLIQIVKNMYNGNKNITKKEVIAELKAQKIKYSSSDIDTIFVILLGVYQ